MVHSHVGSVHAENAGQKIYLRKKDNCCILNREAFQLRLIQAGNFDQETTAEERNGSDEYEYRNQLNKRNDENIAKAQYAVILYGMVNYPVAACKTINKYFNQFYLCNNKAEVDKEVQHSRCYILKHFLLAKGNQQHVFPAFAGVIGIILLAAQHNIAVNTAVTEKRPYTGKYGKGDKNEYLEVNKHKHNYERSENTVKHKNYK